VRYSGVRMRPGDVIRSTERIDDYSEREGRMGLQLYTTVSNEFTNQFDERIKVLYTVYCRYR
jgi:N-terminal half of MaoC dehydratase